MTYRKMGELTQAREWYEKGITKHFGWMYRKLRESNTLEAKRIGYIEFEGGKWTEVAMQAFIYFAVLEGYELVM
jgi:hypothetical protein